MAKKTSKTDKKVENPTIEAPLRELQQDPGDEQPVETPVEAPTEGEDDPITGDAHNCMAEGKIQSISVGGVRMSQCKVCGKRF